MQLLKDEQLEASTVSFVSLAWPYFLKNYGDSQNQCDIAFPIVLPWGNVGLLIPSAAASTSNEDVVRDGRSCN